MTSFFKRFSPLCRLPIAAFAACSAIVGHLLAQTGSFPTGSLIALAVFILAAGASALNQYQERRIDALMERTRLRPLPAKRVTPAQAFSFSLTLIITGLAVLFLGSGTVVLMLGVLAVVWYNLVYTRLKRLTPFAAVPGAIVGMIAPAIGWASAGGGISDRRLLVVCFLFFIWQVPHFWLQLLHHGEEYERAGLPSLSRVLDKSQLARVTFVWILATAVSALLLPLYGVISSTFLSCMLLPGSAWLALRSLELIKGEPPASFALAAFRMVNGYLFLVMLLVSVETLI